MMRRAFIAVLLLVLAAAAATSQDWEDPQVWRKLGLTEEEVGRARAIYERTEQVIREAQVELDVLKAEMRRLLYREQVEMAAVEKQLRASMEWEYRLRLAQITRQVELRRLLGDRKYARLMEEVRERRREARGGDGGAGGDGPGRGGPGR
jgi:hypothetical protein